ncbi:MAG: hypothetical protein Q8L23_16895 [Caulobacter sp.]|nr:hypothetical protein [Caulobacter sp.]
MRATVAARLFGASRLTEWGDDPWQAVMDMIRAANDGDRAQETV